MSDLPFVALILLVTFALADFVRFLWRYYTCRHRHEAVPVLFEVDGKVVCLDVCSHCGEEVR